MKKAIHKEFTLRDLIKKPLFRVNHCGVIN